MTIAPHQPSPRHEHDGDEDRTGSHRLPDSEQPPDPLLEETGEFSTYSEVADRRPPYDELMENLRAMVAAGNTQLGEGLTELHMLAELASRGDLPEDVAVEALGEADALGNRFTRALTTTPGSKVAENNPDVAHHFATLRRYQNALTLLKRRVYHTDDPEAIVPDVVVNIDDPDAQHHALHDDKQTIAWTGFPVEVYALPSEGPWQSRDEPVPTAVLKMGHKGSWVMERPHGGQTDDLDPGGSVDLQVRRLGEIRVRNASPHGIELIDATEHGLRYRTYRYPTPSELRLREARRSIDAA